MTTEKPWPEQKAGQADTQLVCRQCGRDFLFSSREQAKYQQRGFDPPRRCPECRKNRSRLAPEEDWNPKRRKNRNREFVE